MDIRTIRKKVRANEYDLSHHAHQERQEEQIFIEELEKTILKGAIIEQYPNDPRGPSCLVATKNLHAVCGFRKGRVLVVTLYRPEPPVWINWKNRARELKDRV